MKCIYLPGSLWVQLQRAHTRIHRRFWKTDWAANEIEQNTLRREKNTSATQILHKKFYYWCRSWVLTESSKKKSEKENSAQKCCDYILCISHRKNVRLVRIFTMKFQLIFFCLSRSSQTSYSSHFDTYTLFTWAHIFFVVRIFVFVVFRKLVFSVSCVIWTFRQCYLAYYVYIFVCTLYVWHSRQSDRGTHNNSQKSHAVHISIKRFSKSLALTKQTHKYSTSKTEHRRTRKKSQRKIIAKQK